MCFGSDSFPETRYFDSSLGKIVSARGNLFYKMGGSRLGGSYESKIDDLSTHELAELLFNGEAHGQMNRERFLNNGYLNVTWVWWFLLVKQSHYLKSCGSCLQVPYPIRSPKDILTMDPYGSGIHIACDCKDDPKVISILTLPFKTTIGHLVGLDVMTKDLEKFKVCCRSLRLYPEMQNKSINIWFTL